MNNKDCGHTWHEYISEEIGSYCPACGEKWKGRLPSPSVFIVGDTTHTVSEFTIVEYPVTPIVNLEQKSRSSDMSIEVTRTVPTELAQAVIIGHANKEDKQQEIPQVKSKITRKDIYHDGDHCPQCEKGTLINTDIFELSCSLCKETVPKQCPTYYDKILCYGCQFTKDCSKRINVSMFRSGRKNEDQ